MSPSRRPTVATIGHQAATVPTFLAALAQAGIELLVDVRTVASSRRPGFSKGTLVAEALAERRPIAIRHLHPHEGEA